MKIKIKETVGSNYSNKPYDITLISLRGKWVEVDTTYLFNDQYNLLDHNIRVFDSMIDAVQDDARIGKVKCGYCGKMFNNTDELTQHYLDEENNAHNCDGCFWYRDRIIDTIRTTTHETNESGHRVDVHTTKYVWEKQCSYNAGCDRFEHRNHKPQYFTKENTYFLKYPDGYKHYFENLSVSEKWRECGYTYDENAKTATQTNIAGSYNATFVYGEHGLLYMTIYNSRKSFVLTREDFENIITRRGSIRYLLAWDGEKKREKPLFDGFPKTYENDLISWLESIQSLCTYSSDAYKKHLYLGEN